MPAFLTTPFVFLFRANFQQQYLAHLIGAVIVVLTILLVLKIKKKNGLAIWSGILIGFSSIIWYLSSVGSVWYLGQITAVLFLLLALIESFGKKRPIIVGLLISMALLSRLQILPSILLFAYLIRNKLDKKNLVGFFAGLSVFVLIYGTYNFLRFGNVFETGYTLIPGILKEPWFEHGQFSLLNIPNHLKIFLAGMPKFSNNIPFVYPSWAGLAIWITTPAFIFSLFSPIKNKVNQLSWAVIVLVALINFSYGSTGFSQFGYRYAVDFYPFLTLLTINGVVNQNGPKWFHWTLLVLGIIVNLWGVLWINKFGWVSF